MIHTFRADDAVELAVLERSGFIESRHIGSAVVLAGDGSVVTALGDISSPIYPRSATKPFQALASMQSGVPFAGRRLPWQLEATQVPWSTWMLSKGC